MPSAEQPFRVVYSEHCLQRLRLWSAQAIRRGRRLEYLAALKEIQHRLTHDPLGWGDPQFPLHALGLMFYRGLRRPLLVYYGVDESSRLVFVTQVRPIPQSGLEEEPEN
jgi:hypothetical protein